jgi:hypothetical protein
MSTVVPQNTTLADLDDTIRALLKRELTQHGIDVEIAFDAPDKEWSGALNNPTINAFLYDLRESKDHRPIEWEVEQAKNGTRELRPPLMLEASYALTAWARAVEDEHRLLSQLLAVLHAYPRLPQELLRGSLTEQRFPLSTKIAQPKSDGKADFWSSIGGTYKASLDYAVTLACDPGTVLERGPEVRTRTVRMLQKDGPRGSMIELHRSGGSVHSADGAPVSNAWVVLEEAGQWTESDAAGHFQFDRLPPGKYTCVVRARDGQEARGELTAPGPGADITLGSKRPSVRHKR